MDTNETLRTETEKCLLAGPAGWSQAAAGFSEEMKWILTWAVQQSPYDGDMQDDFEKHFSKHWGRRDGSGFSVKDAFRILHGQSRASREWFRDKDPVIDQIWPALRLIWLGPRCPQRIKTRWEAAGGRIYGGKMLARKDSPVWSAFNTFGHPYGPYDMETCDLLGIELQMVDDLPASFP